MGERESLIHTHTHTHTKNTGAKFKAPCCQQVRAQASSFSPGKRPAHPTQVCAGVSMAAATPFDPENGRHTLQLATRMKKKRLPPPWWGLADPCPAKRVTSPPNTGKRQPAAWQVQLGRTREAVFATPRRRLDVTPPRGPAHPQPQGSRWAHPTRQMFRGELLKQPWQVSKHLGG